VFLRHGGLQVHAAVVRVVTHLVARRIEGLAGMLRAKLFTLLTRLQRC
jgi:hypothetical protein